MHKPKRLRVGKPAAPPLPSFIQPCFLLTLSPACAGALFWPLLAFTHLPSKPSARTCCVPGTVMGAGTLQELSLPELMMEKQDMLQSRVGLRKGGAEGEDQESFLEEVTWVP